MFFKSELGVSEHNLKVRWWFIAWSIRGNRDKRNPQTARVSFEYYRTKRRRNDDMPRTAQGVVRSRNTAYNAATLTQFFSSSNTVRRGRKDRKRCIYLPNLRDTSLLTFLRTERKLPFSGIRVHIHCICTQDLAWSIATLRGYFSPSKLEENARGRDSDTLSKNLSYPSELTGHARLMAA